MQEIEKLVQAVKDGEEYALKAYTELKRMGDVSAWGQSEVYDLAIKEADQYPEKRFGYNGFKIEKTNSATRWDFKGVKQVEELEKQLSDLKDALKKAFIAKDKNIFDIVADGGEVMDLPKMINGKSIIKLTAEKN